MTKPSIRHRLEQAEALVAEKQANYEKAKDSLKGELRSAQNEVRRAKAELGKGSTPKRLEELKGKKAFLSLRVEALENAADEVIDAKDKLIGLYNEDLRGGFEKMSGMLAYAAATGGGLSPDAQLLRDSLDDYLKAENDSDRQAAYRAVALCFAHGNFVDSPRSETRADDHILKQLEGISDPEQATAFYGKHRDEIHRAYEARKNNP